MIVLDTNIVSEMMKEEPDSNVLGWLDRQPRISLWTTVITVWECRFGIERLALGRRREALTRAFEALLDNDLEGRILAFDHQDADATARWMAAHAAEGRSGDFRDSMIAGIVRLRRAQLATRNIRHFEHWKIDLVDPWASTV